MAVSDESKEDLGGCRMSEPVQLRPIPEAAVVGQDSDDKQCLQVQFPKWSGKIP